MSNPTISTTTTSLPPSASPDLHLVPGTASEIDAQTLANSAEWRGPLTLPAYLRREALLLQEDLTRDGGLTAWMLVHQPAGKKEEERVVLCGCESIRKRALLLRPGREEVEDVWAHGVASVFCPAALRGRGYAGRMMEEVGRKLRDWQDGMEGRRVVCSVLYSDIGRTFYARKGWRAGESTHVALMPAEGGKNEGVTTLMSKDLDELCAADERLLRARMRGMRGSAKAVVALVPDRATMDWHHAREDFVATELHGDNGQVPGFMREGGRGALVRVREGVRAWCVWTRVWTGAREEKGNTLHVLRMVMEGEEGRGGEEEGAAVAKLLGGARRRAHEAGMSQVQVWNPSAVVLAGARRLEPGCDLVVREKESIASMRWYLGGQEEEVEWVCNEKFGWC